MGCVLSSERSADDFGADSRTMLARPKPRVLGVIPARYNSRRFAGKPLALLGGKPLVMHVYRNACKAKCLDACVVATDDDRIAKAVRDNGGEVIMTDAACETGLERCLEVVRKLRRRRADGKKGTTWTAASGEFDVVVCIDADEPFVQPHHIETVADLVINSDAVVGTLVRRGLNEEDVASADTVKVVTDDRDYALLFSREPVPRRGSSAGGGGVVRSAYDPGVAYKVRVGIQACGTDFLEKYASLPGCGGEGSIEPSRVADKENTSPRRTTKNGDSSAIPPYEPPDEPEQNRVVFAGYKVKVDVVESTFVPGVKTPEDLRHLNAGLGAGLVNDLQLTFLVA